MLYDCLEARKTAGHGRQDVKEAHGKSCALVLQEALEQSLRLIPLCNDEVRIPVVADPLPRQKERFLSLSKHQARYIDQAIEAL